MAFTIRPRYEPKPLLARLHDFTEEDRTGLIRRMLPGIIFDRRQLCLRYLHRPDEVDIMGNGRHILILNGGSSSLKFAVCEGSRCGAWTRQKTNRHLCGGAGWPRCSGFHRRHGEHSRVIRNRICDGLGFLGVELDPALNASASPVISAASADVEVRLIAAGEEAVIAAAVKDVLTRKDSSR